MAIKKASNKYPGIYINEYKNGNIAYYINYRNEENKPTIKKVGMKTKQSNFTKSCLLFLGYYNISE